MSTDQFDPQEVVRVRMQLADGREAWSPRMSRMEAARWLASAEWLCAPQWKGEPVRTAAIVAWTYN